MTTDVCVCVHVLWQRRAKVSLCDIVFACMARRMLQWRYWFTLMRSKSLAVMMEPAVDRVTLRTEPCGIHSRECARMMSE